MPTPPKPLALIENEKRSHRTKAEKSVRRDFEEACASGVAIKEWSQVKDNPEAHKEFQRVVKLLKKIDKNDALYQGVINRYCLLIAECSDFERKRELFQKNLEDMIEAGPPEDGVNEYYKTQAAMQQSVIACDRQVMQKRKMLLDIEKENIMTIASVLRSIPKKPDTQGGQADPMAGVLGRGRRQA